MDTGFCDPQCLVSNVPWLESNNEQWPIHRNH
jgi:hypothetical protein